MARRRVSIYLYLSIYLQYLSYTYLSISYLSIYSIYSIYLRNRTHEGEVEGEQEDGLGSGGAATEKALIKNRGERRGDLQRGGSRRRRRRRRGRRREKRSGRRRARIGVGDGWQRQRKRFSSTVLPVHLLLHVCVRVSFVVGVGPLA